MVGGKGNLAARRYAVHGISVYFFAHRAINSEIVPRTLQQSWKVMHNDLDCQAPCCM
jgi:hypothetical protein